MLTEVHGERLGLGTAAKKMAEKLEQFTRLEFDLAELMLRQRKDPEMVFEVEAALAPGLSERMVLQVPITDLIKALKTEIERMLNDVIKDLADLQDARQRLVRFDASRRRVDENQVRLVGPDRNHLTESKP